MDLLNAAVSEFIASTTKKDIAKHVGRLMKEAWEKSPDRCIPCNPDTVIDVIKVMRSYVKKSVSITNYSSILPTVLAGQLGFYSLSKHKNDDLLMYYLELYKNCERIYSDITKMKSPESGVMSIPFRFNVHDVLANNIQAAKEYSDSLIPAIKAIYAGRLNRSIESILNGDSEEAGLLSFYAIINDVPVNITSWENKMDLWPICYQAYKLHYIDGLDKVPIISKLNLNNNDLPNEIHKLDRYLDYAEALVDSAEKGIFPYLIPTQ